MFRVVIIIDRPLVLDTTFYHELLVLEQALYRPDGPIITENDQSLSIENFPLDSTFFDTSFLDA